MPDIIRLLPDAVANQIAAGEVVQRPSSAVKELLENSIDAGADYVEIFIADVGKKLIQVKDNGCGMSSTDARRSLERHATSKIQKADDLFQIKTMGFRGEAIASIVAVSKTEIHTKRPEDEVGTVIEVEASEIRKQEPSACSNGTDIKIKNLFYNIPARRKFLKSNAVELKHIIDQFQRVALAYPKVGFRMVNEDTELFNLPKSALRQRIVNIFGKNYNERLVPMNEEAVFVNVQGFLCKPEHAKKKRGEQYLFINNRFIKSNYLHHAISRAYQDLLPKNVHPSYFVFLETDPSFIDINIHPTKTEAKFEDERSVYAVLHSAARKALGSNNIAPSLDFERETTFDAQPTGAIKPPEIKINTAFNPFEHQQKDTPSFRNSSPSSSVERTKKSSPSDWESMYAILQQNDTRDLPKKPEQTALDNDSFENTQVSHNVLTLWSKYIVTQTKQQLILIHIGRAYQRIIYEDRINAMANNTADSQQLLFPEQITLSSSDTALMQALLPDLIAIGFDLEHFGENDFVVRGMPSDIADAQPQQLLEGILEHYDRDKTQKTIEKRKQLAANIAREGARSLVKKFNKEQANTLVDRLFACEQPYTSPSGKTSIIHLSAQDLESQFK